MSQKTFRELCNNNPSIAIKALIDGLLEPNRIPWLKLDFDTFGNIRNNKCYGCGATLAVLRLRYTNNLTELATIVDGVEFINRKTFQLIDSNAIDLAIFEESVDSFRLGYIDDLNDYFNSEIPEPIIKWRLTNNTWFDELHLVISYYQQLTKCKYIPPASLDPKFQPIFDRLVSLAR